MAQLIVRKIENAVKTKLQNRAKRHGRSMEEELRDILRNVVNEEDTSVGLGTEISNLFSGIGVGSEIPEIRGHKIKPVFR